MLTKVILSSLLVNFGKDILIKKSEKVLTIKKVAGGIGLNMAHNGGCYTMAGASTHPSIDLRQIKKVQNRL